MTITRKKYNKLNLYRNEFRQKLLPLMNLKDKSNNQIKEFIKNVKLFFSDENKNDLINTLIPISKDRKPVIIDIDKKLTVKPPPIVDYVSISSVILDNIVNNTIKKLYKNFIKTL